MVMGRVWWFLGCTPLQCAWSLWWLLYAFFLLTREERKWNEFFRWIWFPWRLWPIPRRDNWDPLLTLNYFYPCNGKKVIGSLSVLSLSSRRVHACMHSCIRTYTIFFFSRRRHSIPYRWRNHGVCVYVVENTCTLPKTSTPPQTVQYTWSLGNYVVLLLYFTAKWLEQFHFFFLTFSLFSDWRV